MLPRMVSGSGEGVKGYGAEETLGRICGDKSKSCYCQQMARDCNLADAAHRLTCPKTSNVMPVVVSVGGCRMSKLNAA